RRGVYVAGTTDQIQTVRTLWTAAKEVYLTLTRGARVIVSGRLKQRSYQTREGDKRTVVELEVDEVGPSLRYATAKVNKRNGKRNSVNTSPDRSGELVGAAIGAPTGGGDDVWATAPGNGSGAGFGGGFSDEPPF
ncbi:single-stranded DNA-binding protein, partial [Nocardia sp. NPDC003979]